VRQHNTYRFLNPNVANLADIPCKSDNGREQQIKKFLDLYRHRRSTSRAR